MALRLLVAAVLAAAKTQDAAETGARAILLASAKRRDEDALETATEAALKIVDSKYGKCGVAAVHLDTGFELPSTMAGQCGVLQYTNCSLSYAQISCPASCPLVAPSRNFPCIFTCVKPEDCGDFSPGHALPNLDSGICEPCGLVGCQLCTSTTSCAQCFPGFVLQDERCAFYLDSNGVSASVLQGLSVLLAFLLLVVFICYCYGKRSRFAEINLQHMVEARRHRHLCKLHRWDGSSNRQPRAWFDLSVNMLEEDISGVGVALYYKRIMHVLLCSLVCLLCLYVLYAPDAIKDDLPTRQESVLNLEEHVFSTSDTAPAVLFSPLYRCGGFTPELRAAALQSFATQNFQATCVMFVVLFVISLHQSLSCFRFFQWFDEQNVDTSDYALLLTGLPSDLTDEAELKRRLEAHLTQRLKGLGARPIHGISICYDFSDFRLQTEVEMMLSHISKKKELELGAVTGRSCVWEQRREEDHLTEVLAEDREKAQSLFAEGKLKSTGRAFVVFLEAQVRDKVLERYGCDRTLLDIPGMPPLALESVDFDPVTVFWENQHNDTGTVVRAAAKGALKVVLFFFAVNCFVILPYNVFVVGTFMASGQDAGGPCQGIAGMLLGLVNQQISCQVYNQAWFAGFRRKERSDTFIFVLNTVVQFFNTWVSLAVAVWASVGRDGSEVNLLQPLALSGNIGLEADIGDSIYNMHVPGVLYINYIMGFVMGAAVPFLQHTLVAKIIYVWRSLPDCLLHVLKLILPWAPDGIDLYPRFNAEKALEAPEMGVAWDYTAFIVHMATALLVTALISESVWKLFAALTLWCVFFALWSRFMHLRVQTASNFNGHLVDTAAWLLWALPMGCLGGSAFVWAVRSDMLPWVPALPLALQILVLLLAVTLAGSLWVVAYLSVVRPFRGSDASASQNETVEDVMRQVPYSWYNCNPAFVLKCAYFKDIDPDSRRLLCRDGAEAEALLYRRGKEYLFLSQEKQKKVMEKLNNALEVETYLEIFFEFCHNVATCWGMKSRSASSLVLGQKTHAWEPLPDSL
ncbi:unnamed protein product [Effrenium voratum]|uniref:Uncharacterized protein n=1 Tax=Effrenium voratum TaxID=2562239 RepID=A0AA36JSS0_9DINO|nr:unnamed protein product [Effrenium voratum]